jgi:hypothetical protein
VKFASVKEAVELYSSIGFRPIPLFGLREGRCACGSPECKDRDAGKHEPPETDGLWKDGTEFGVEHFDDHDNVALAMGPWGGSDDWLVTLDIDGPLDLDGFMWNLPRTLEQKSPRGRHLIFSVPAYTPLGNWVDVLQTRDTHRAQLDLRYARGRIVVAPSENSFGRYEWTDFREPAALPQSAIDAILDRRVERGLSVQWEWSRGGKRP